MKTLKEIKVTKIDNGMNAYPLPEEIQKWTIENTMFKSQPNINIIYPFSLILAPGMMMPPTSIRNFKPGTSNETEYNVLAKNIAFKNNDGKWDIYEKVIFNIYNRKSVNEESKEDTTISRLGFDSFGSSKAIADDWNVTIKTDDAPLIYNLSLEELFDNLLKISE